MLPTFQLLKSSWGIVIFLDVSDSPTLTHEQECEKITDNIYLSIKTKNVQQEKLLYWFSKAILDVKEQISKAITQDVLCLEVNDIHFSLTDFQDEGLYYAMQEWLSKRFGFGLPPHGAFYDAGQNTYIFPNIEAYMANAPK